MSVRLFTGPWRARQEWSAEWLSRAQRIVRAWTGPATAVCGRDFIKLGADLALITVAAAWAWLVAFGQLANPASAAPFLVAVLCARLPIHLGLRLYSMPWRKVSRQDAMWLGASALAGPPLVLLLYLILPHPFALDSLGRPHLVLFTESALYLVLLGGVRVSARTLSVSRRHRTAAARRTLVVGTGDAARSLVWQIQESVTDYLIVGFVDDDPDKRGRRILGLSVMGRVDELPRAAAALRAEQIVVAIPSLTPERRREILLICEETGLPVRVLPPLRELMGTGVGVGALREVSMEDLLPRSQVTLERSAVVSVLEGRTVLVTGGGGSIGRELCRQIVGMGAARLLVLGRGENSIYEAVQEISDEHSSCEVVPVICDVQNAQALALVFEQYRPQVVFHAAAHKHVPLMEQYPAEAVRNNVLGTLNVARLAVDRGAERFVLVSTDKAVDPSSVMGSTKRVAEMIVKAYAVARGANMVSVRFGNVLGSRGSVIPLMARQIRNGGPVTVTDPDMVRYFMTIPEAAQLILRAAAVGGKGEVFVLDMGHPVRIIDLAEHLIRLSGLIPERDVPILVTGRRPGEKLREDFLSKMESAGAEKREQFYIAPPEPVALKELLTQVHQLRLAAAAAAPGRIVSLLQRIVPDFRPDPTQWDEAGCTALTKAATGRAQ